MRCEMLDRVMVGRGVIVADRRARFHRRSGYAIDDEPAADDVGSTGDRRRGLRRIALGVEKRDIAGRSLPDEQGIGFDSTGGTVETIANSSSWRVDRDQLGRVLGGLVPRSRQPQARRNRRPSAPGP